MAQPPQVHVSLGSAGLRPRGARSESRRAAHPPPQPPRQGRQATGVVLRARDGNAGEEDRGGEREWIRRGAWVHRLAAIPGRVPGPVCAGCVRCAGPARGVPGVVPLARGDLRTDQHHLLAAQDVRGLLHPHPPLLSHGHQRARGARGRDRHGGDPGAHPQQHPPLARRALQHHHLRHPRAAGALLLRRQHHAVLRDGHPAAASGAGGAAGQGRRGDRVPRRGRHEALPPDV
mmetsp:Transcript_30018/g.74455  ORF Transcript_30018/g.74455 Transcript_30018/m.74455 type:complete len:232 (+) Transcript_30018:753-1448(+)